LNARNKDQTKRHFRLLFVTTAAQAPGFANPHVLFMFCSCEVTNMKTRFEHVEFMNKRFIVCQL
tara:strand:- start:29 stop:220 length:192 start_codon:yes stop_codon:yes gene_type:complete